MEKNSAPDWNNINEYWGDLSRALREWNTKVGKGEIDYLQKFNHAVIFREILEKPKSTASYQNGKYIYKVFFMMGSESLNVELDNPSMTDFNNDLSFYSNGVRGRGMKFSPCYIEFIFNTSKLLCYVTRDPNTYMCQDPDNPYGQYGVKWGREGVNSTKVVFSSVTLKENPTFEGIYRFDPMMQSIFTRMQELFPNIMECTKKTLKRFEMCGEGNQAKYQTFLYCNYDNMGVTQDSLYTQACILYDQQYVLGDDIDDVLTKIKGKAYVSKGDKKWVKLEGTQWELKFSKKPVSEQQRVFCNDFNCHSKPYFIRLLGLEGAGVEYIEHPRYTRPEAYKCNGEKWEDAKDDYIPNIESDSDSKLTEQIPELLEQHNRKYYLIGQTRINQEAGLTHRLYLFNTGLNDPDVTWNPKLEIGGLKPENKIVSLNDVPCYENKNCQWVQIQEKVSDFDFNIAIDDMDSNLSILEDRLRPEQVKAIGIIYYERPNVMLNKKFPSCEIGGDGGGDGGGGDGGGGGITPPEPPKPPIIPPNPFPPFDPVDPFPPPYEPPCDIGGGFSPKPVSEIRLLKVPELSPSYQDTYDFGSKGNQETFFQGRTGITLRNYSYVRKDNAIMADVNVDDVHCFNYLMYKNKQGKWYYCFIMSKEYVNERTTRIIIATDVIQTYLFDYSLRPCYVERCHVDRWKDDGTPTDEFEPEDLEFGEPIQVETMSEGFKAFKDSYVIVTSSPLGVIPSREKKTEEEQKE